MKHNSLALALGLGLAFAFTADIASAQAQPDPNRVYVKFKKGAKGNVEAALRGAGGRIHYSFDGIDAFAVTLPPQALDGIRRNPNVELVEPDAPRYLLGQSTPYGIDLVQARDVWDANRDGTPDSGAPTGSGITVCIIDSGIKANHEDFAGIAMNTGGVTERIYGFARALVGHFTGGLGHVNITGSLIFSGMSGSAIADAATSNT